MCPATKLVVQKDVERFCLQSGLRNYWNLTRTYKNTIMLTYLLSSSVDVLVPTCKG